MRKACISIGVDRVAGAANLPPLQAAADGAERFAQWATSQGFESFCLTDRGRVLSVADVKSQVRALVTSGAYGQLVIYFAGHGILKSWDTEIWLLTDAANDPNEAVNLVGSVSLGRNSGIPHIVFISDAWRSIASDARLAQVTGSILFPIRPVTPQRPEVDTFYATLPGDPAYEASPAQAAADYSGVFTRCLLQGLQGPDPSVCEVVDEGRGRQWVVSSRTLKPWLEREVPQSLAAVSVALNQVPDLRVESQKPKYLSLLSGPPPSPPPPDFGAPPSPGQPSPAAVLRNAAEGQGVRKYFAPEVEIRSAPLSPETSQAFNDDVSRLLAARGRESFETHTGFTLVGAQVAEALLNGEAGHCDVFPENGAVQIRVRPAAEWGSVVIQFVNGQGTCLTAFSGFVGAVTVEDGRVVNVSYAPARNTPRWNDYQVQQAEVERRRAFAAVAARRGILKIERDQAASFAGFVREFKMMDPTLGIYAAYAYAQAGMIDGVQSVFEWMRNDPQVPVPFDVAMLANRLSPPGQPGTRIAGIMPMLTQGWALLHEGLPVAPWLAQANRYTQPALWTTLSAEGVAFVAQRLHPPKAAMART
ncbi:MAG: caspase family protein [Acidobacteriia bacterium]|nr:caspase family protein [Terriglobia bacterium]